MSFQSTPSAWRETNYVKCYIFTSIFQSTPSAWRETEMAITDSAGITISIHSLRMEGDHSITIICISRYYFNPLPPHGGRPGGTMHIWMKMVFQSTPSAWRETVVSSTFLNVSSSFQSTPSAWRETKIVTTCICIWNIISIHSLRMEGDNCICKWYSNYIYFNPLPPHGGRLVCRYHLIYIRCISIHSLRMEGDHLYGMFCSYLCISIHSLRMEGDTSPNIYI